MCFDQFLAYDRRSPAEASGGTPADALSLLTADTNCDSAVASYPATRCGAVVVVGTGAAVVVGAGADVVVLEGAGAAVVVGAGAAVVGGATVVDVVVVTGTDVVVVEGATVVVVVDDGTGGMVVVEGGVAPDRAAAGAVTSAESTITS
jgi:hypothetical protein